MEHICGQCEKGFDTEEKYLDHKCEETGFKPTDPKSLGKEFEAISEAALERGAARAKLEKEGKSREEALKADK